jgi:hypothetical protein
MGCRSAAGHSTAPALLNRFWPVNCRARAIDHLLYQINSGLWRWVTERRGNVLRSGVKWLLGLGQPLPRPVLICADSKVLVEFDSLHFCLPLQAIHQR